MYQSIDFQLIDILKQMKSEPKTIFLFKKIFHNLLKHGKFTNFAKQNH